MTTMLVSVEGIDGSGTTTQSQEIVLQLKARGIPAHWTSEPTGGPEGKLIREMLAGPGPVDPWRLALLFAADRRAHQAEIREHLDKREVVVCCRYLDSSLVYQGAMIQQAHQQGIKGPGYKSRGKGHGDGGTKEWLYTLQEGVRKPDLILLLNVPVEEAQKRRAGRSGHAELTESAEIQRKAWDGFRQLFYGPALHPRQNAGRYVLVDAKGIPDRKDNRNLITDNCLLHVRDAMARLGLADYVRAMDHRQTEASRQPTNLAPAPTFAPGVTVRIRKPKAGDQGWQARPLGGGRTGYVKLGHPFNWIPEMDSLDGAMANLHGFVFAAATDVRMRGQPPAWLVRGAWHPLNPSLDKEPACAFDQEWLTVEPF